MKEEKVTVKAITIYPNEQSVITKVAAVLFEGNESRAVRYIIRDWAQSKKLDEVGVPTGMFEGYDGGE